MPKLEFGLFLEFTTSDDERLDEQVDRYLPIIGLAESLGFRSVWVGESYPPARGAIQHISSPFLVLSHLAHQTSMTLGTAVSLAPVWDPLRLAYDTSVLDQLCGGRLILGVGLGNPGIWKRFGVDRDSVGQRTDETLLALRALWAGEDGYEGDLVKVIGGYCTETAAAGRPTDPDRREDSEIGTPSGDSWRRLRRRNPLHMGPAAHVDRVVPRGTRVSRKGGRGLNGVCKPDCRPGR